MKTVVLMNRNRPVMKIRINERYRVDAVIEIYNPEYAPLSIRNACFDKSVSVVKAADSWLADRGIPSWRDDLSETLEALQIPDTGFLRLTDYALSLSDTYWLRPEDQPDTDWEQIHRFGHPYNDLDFLHAAFCPGRRIGKPDLQSPSGKTDGMLRKAWIQINGRNLLIKAGGKAYQQEALNEIIASEICRILRFDHCSYTLQRISNTCVSVCEDMIGPDQEMIPAADIFFSQKKPNDVSDPEHYIRILEANGVLNARTEVEHMLIVDFVMMNTDRHFHNFGVIRNTKTLQWERVIPIFDTGTSLCCEEPASQMNWIDGRGKFFTNSQKKFSQFLKYVDLAQYDFSGLEKAVDVIDREKEILDQIQFPEDRRDQLKTALQYRIQALQKAAANRKQRGDTNSYFLYR